MMSKYLLSIGILLTLGSSAGSVYGQEHCRVRYQYNASGDRIQRDWHCWTPGDEENDPDNWEYKSRNVLAVVHMQVAPNPANDRFIISLPVDAPTEGMFELMNTLGEVLLSQRSTGTQTAIDVSSIPNGAYFIRYNSGHESIISSCVVQH